MKKIWFPALAVLLLSGLFFLPACHPDNNPQEPDEHVVPDVPDLPPVDIEAQLSAMTLREKVGQLFYIRPEKLDTTVDWNADDNLIKYSLQEVTDKMRGVNEKYPVGGIVIYAHNINDGTQLTRFVRQLHALNGSPLVCIDEEGGRVARIANNSHFQVRKFTSMAAIGATGDPDRALECGNVIGFYLKSYGIDVNFAPVADVNTNPDNIVIGNRAFSDRPEVAAPMVTNYLQGLKNSGIVGCIKHFPGHGDTKNDTHYGYAQSLKTWDQMLACEMIPFKAGIDWGCRLVMTAHIAAPNVTGSDIPATLSPVILQDKLRGELGYQNVIITDGMEMGAITQQFTNAEATVGSIKAGADIILGPMLFTEAFDAVMKAVENGEITEARIDESVRRILALKAECR